MKKALKMIVWSAFIFYCLVLLYIFVLTRINTHIRPYESIQDFLWRVNLIPFKTVYEYVSKIIHDQINLDTAIGNLVGNLAVFLPMGAFLPFMFQKTRSFKRTDFIRCFTKVSLQKHNKKELRLCRSSF